jgi:hypothetical protein
VLAAQVSTLEGFTESFAGAFEDTATDAVYRHLKKTHSSVKVLDIREITAADGSKREVDGAVVADGYAAIVEAKHVLEEAALWRLSSCPEFIRCDSHICKCCWSISLHMLPSAKHLLAGLGAGAGCRGWVQG